MGQATYEIPERMVEETRQFRAQVERFLAGEVEKADFRPAAGAMGVYEQRREGTFMVRARGAAGLFLARQARRIAELSARHGSGRVHVTTRQDLQIHGVALADVPGVVDAILDAGTPSRGSGGNTVRNVTTCPLAGACRDEAFDVTPYALALTQYLIADPRSFALPRKLKTALSGCPEDCALASVADLGLFAHVRGGAPGFSVYAAGGLGLNPAVAVPLEEFVPAAELFEVVEAIKRLFDRHGDRANRHRARLRFVLERVGEEEFRRMCREERARVRAEGLRFPVADGGAEPRGGKAPAGPAGSEPPPAPPQPLDPPGPPDWPGGPPAGPAYRAWLERHVAAQKQAGLFAVRVRIPRGHVAAAHLSALAGLALSVGNGALRATQDQDLRILDVAESALPGLYHSLRALDEAFVTAPPVRCLSCVGAGICRLGHRHSGGLAAAIEAELRDLPMVVEPPIRISGCPNCCGQHPAAPVGLSGGAVRVHGAVLPVYTLFAGGRAGEGTAALGEPIGKVPARAVPALLREFWFAAAGERREGERIPALMARWGAARLRELAPRYQEAPPFAEAPEFYEDFASEA